MTLFSVAFLPVNLNWPKLPQFLRKAVDKAKLTIGPFQSCLFLSASVVILNIIIFCNRFKLALGKSAQLIMHR